MRKFIITGNELKKILLDAGQTSLELGFTPDSLSDMVLDAYVEHGTLKEITEDAPVHLPM